MSGRIDLKSWCTMCLFLLGMGCTTAAGRIIYVDVDANGLNDGSSWADAYTYLQNALADANACAKPVEIRVAQGIYKPDQGAGITLGDRQATFHLINGVTLQGGYAGFGDPDPNVRDIKAYETILSGDLDGNDVEVIDPCDLPNEPSRAENSYHVVTSSGTDETAILDGFTITGGYANGEGWPVCLNRGGGIYSDSGSPTLMNCTISGNSASVGGGIENHGGGMYNHLNCNPTIINCAISSNNGGGIRSSGSPMLINCTISGNNGCGMINGLGSPTLNNCTISGNNGGGWESCDSYSTLINCVFVGNSSDWDGGAWFSWDSDSVLVNCVFVRNSASRDGGGIYSTSDYSMTLTNCILWGNSDSGGMDASAQIDGGGSINYCCIQGGLGGIGNIGADPCFVDSGRWVDANDPNIIVEPNDPNAVWVDGDYHLKSQAGRWDANEQRWTIDEVTSPCIDAGDPMSHLGPEAFPNGGIINMGAYGGTAEASKSYFDKPPCETIVAGDINGDCRVDFADLALLGLHWLECTAPECETVIEVSTTTDKSTYLLGEEVTVFVTAYNPNAEPVTLGAGFYFASYIMDGVYDWAEGRSAPAVITSMTIEPHDSCTWELKHGSYEMGVYPLNVGTHTVVGEVLGYGESAPAEFEVRSE